jgi:hypothetical protein
MKQRIIILSLLSASMVFSISAQTIQDTKDFIKEQIEANFALPSYRNQIFFNTCLLKNDADNLSGITLSNDQFENIFISGRSCYTDDRCTNKWLQSAESTDIRDIKKITVTKQSLGQTYPLFGYYIRLYSGNNNKSTRYELAINSNPRWFQIEKVEIIIADNPDAAQKLKKAFIYLGKLQGITIIDGDYF